MQSVGDKVVARMPYLLLACALVWVTVHAWAPLSDPDSWWHLRLGEDFLHQHSLAAPDHWSSFATVAWSPSEPLPEVAVALVNRVGGLPAVVWVYVATALLVVVAVFLVSRLRAAPLPAAVATLLFVAAGQGSLTARPQLISFLLLLVTVEMWRRSEEDLRPRWWLVPLTWAWSLCHGFWFVGVGYGLLAVVAIALGRRASRRQLVRLAGVAVGAGLAVLLNPVGPGVFEEPFRVSDTSAYITEWQRPGLTNGPALTVTAMVVAVAVIWVVRRSGFTWLTVGLLVSAAFWSWYAQRTVVLGALVAAPLLAAAIQSLLPESAEPDAEEAEIRSRRRERTVVLGLTGALLVLVAFVVPHTADAPGDVPTALDPQLDRLPSGTPVFNAYELGGWITWRHPDLNQYIDGLITPYSAAHMEGFHRTQVLEPGWYAVVQDSDAPVALLASNSTLAAALRARGWTSSGTDAGYVLLHRPTATTG